MPFKNIINITIVFFIMMILISCKSEREKKIEAINKQSCDILSNALAEIMVDGNKINSDSIMNVYIKISSDSAELGLKYAMNISEAVRIYKTGINNNESMSTSSDTIKYFEIKLVDKKNIGGYAELTFQFKNLLEKHIDKFWLDATLRDKNENYLAGKDYVMLDNIRPNGIGIDDASWENINLKEIGKVILTPSTLEIEGQDYQFNESNVRILPNKFGINVTF